MARQTSGSLNPSKSSRIGLVAIILALLAGILGLLSAYMETEHAGTAFWLRLLMGIGFLASGILQIVARQKTNRKLKDFLDQENK